MNRVALVVLCCVASALALDNGLALTPPMGWMSWQYFRATVDCKTYPDDCLTEGLFHQQADHLVQDGYLAAGYNSLHFDDAVVDLHRDANGNLQGDLQRFPSGLKALGDYLHVRGLQLAIYSDIGNATCGGYPGTQGHIDSDVKTFVSWGSDYLKLDGCFASEADFARDYPAMSKALLKSGRPMVYSCSWPAYLNESAKALIYPELQQICNLWRQFDDIQNSWDSMVSIVDYWGDNQDVFAKYAGPGSWNDPDMLIIGASALSQSESEVQMAMWAIFAAPLIMGNDLRKITQWQRDILLNREVILINQDSLGIQGRRLTPKGTFEVWSRPLNNSDVAVALLSKCDNCGIPMYVNATWDLLGFGKSAYHCRDVFSHQDLGLFAQQISLRVEEHGVRLIRCSPTE